MLVCLCKYCFGIKIVPIHKPSKLRRKPPAKKLTRYSVFQMLWSTPTHIYTSAKNDARHFY